MLCAECEALLSEYMAATELYATLSAKLTREPGDRVASPSFKQLSDEVTQARLDCQRARRFLHDHRKGHSPLKSKLPHI